jgi:DNA invertase Pin-like site-specific DNA recombinase
LGGIDQVVVQSAGDLPGRKVHDLLNFLDRLKDHGVGLYLVTEDIDTGNGAAFTLLEIVEAYRRAKLSQAIRAGQARALAAGKMIGRPQIPASVRRRIVAALAHGDTSVGIRSTARKFGVSPATVINIRNAMSLVEAVAA